jgi:alkanesulfonate monooxygenase SsuD/methylene tetrahydromethanopterin reductase-like flavin-dependent oxidoreductase (luciferase family)
MRVGCYLDLRNPPRWERPWDQHYARTLERCVEVERLGLDSVWCSEHHLFEDGYLPQPLTFLAAVAAVTDRIRLGTAVYLGALRPPVQVAEEAAVVDLLSGGRLELGLGAGYRVPEYAAFGADIARRYTLTDACAREVRRLWREGAVTPPPIQDPVPIWMGYQGPQGARRAGLLGEGLLSVDRALLEPYRAGLVEGGHDPATARMAGVVSFVLADDPEAAWPRIREHLAYQWDSYHAYGAEGTGRDAPRPIDPDRWRTGSGDRPPRFEVLSPEDAAARLVALADGVPLEEVYCWASIAGMPDDLVDRHLELLATRLRPLVA